jgi:ParB-like chromosome segregation protein Spo0J
MADHMRDALEKMLDAYDARRQGDQEREQKIRDDDAQFLQRFQELRRGVIRPVFEAAGTMLEARGHRYSITEQESMAGDAGKISEAGISLRIIPAGTRAPVHDDQRSLSITTRHYNKTVWINTGEAPNAGGIAGAKGAHALEKVTRQLIEEELLGFVARIVAA